MKKIIVLILALISFSCIKENNKTEQPSSESTSKIDTINSLTQTSNALAIFKAPDGSFYVVEFVEEQAEELGMTNEIRSSLTDSKKCVTEQFAGTDRKNVKTTALNIEYENFSNLNELIATLPADNFMREQHIPKITRDSKSPRCEEEKRNVAVENVYLYSIYRESDNDYHIIIGSSQLPDESVLLNIEVSGLPSKNSASYRKIKSTRDSIKSKFGEIECNRKRPIFEKNPIKVKVKGTLFYDIDHEPGKVGTGKYKPTTSWEIHPVTEVDFN